MDKINENVKVPKRILSSLLSSVSAGVVPRAGAPYIAIGRGEEIAAFLSDLEEINEGGSAMRFLIGRYGSGKSFLIQLIRGYATERGFVCADADLSPERRLYGSAGSGLATYRELMKNLSTKASPDAGALPIIISKWIDSVRGTLISEGTMPNSEDFDKKLYAKIYTELQSVEGFVGSFDLSNIICEYYKAYVGADDEKKSACMRWLRGEYANKTEARLELGFRVSTVIDDDNWYDFIKLWAALVRKMGYRGLVVFIDECVNLYKITNRVSRENNYEKILSMFNDTLQGRAPGLGIVFGGTPQFLEDTRRGLFSYEALRSRLCDSRFASDEFVNMIGPVIRLRRLSDDELLALISRITRLYEQYYGRSPRVGEQDMADFLALSLSRAGAGELMTPREILRDYMTVLNILMQNDNVAFADIMNKFTPAKEETKKDVDFSDIEI